MEPLELIAVLERVTKTLSVFTVPLILIVCFYPSGCRKRIRNVALLFLIGSYLILIGIHAQRFWIMYTKTDLREFPFPLVAYPLLLAAILLGFHRQLE